MQPFPQGKGQPRPTSQGKNGCSTALFEIKYDFYLVRDTTRN